MTILKSKSRKISKLPKLLRVRYKNFPYLPNKKQFRLNLPRK